MEKYQGSTDDVMAMMELCREQLKAIDTAPSLELLLAMADLAFRVKWRLEDQEDKMAELGQ